MSDVENAILVRTPDLRLLIVPAGHDLPAGLFLRPATTDEMVDVFSEPMEPAG